MRPYNEVLCMEKSIEASYGLVTILKTFIYDLNVSYDVF